MMYACAHVYAHVYTEVLFFGPDENTANLMDAGAYRAKLRGYYI